MERWSVGRAHRRLVVWQRAIELTLEARAIAKRLPASERGDLASQLRRAAYSVPANIAEANGRHHRGDQLRFLSIARGSLMELDTHFEIAERSGYVSEPDLAQARALIENVSLLLSRLARTISLHS